jgi:signal transduction histidine kinase
MLMLFVFFADKKSEMNQNLAIFILILLLWTVVDMLEWMIPDREIVLLLSRLALLNILSLYFFLRFTYAYIGKALNSAEKFFFFLPFSPVLLLLFTKYNASMVNNENCDVAFGPLYGYVYLLMIVYMFWSVKMLISHWRANRNNEIIKKQSRLIIGGLILLVVWFMLFMLVTDYSVSHNYSWGDTVFIFTPFGSLFFVAFVTYAITRYQFLNIKLVLAEVFTIGVAAIISAQLFLSQSFVNIILTGITLVITAMFGIMLVKSIKAEFQRNEELKAANVLLGKKNMELKKNKKKLEAAYKELKKLDQAKSEFINIASHQLRTPISVIKSLIYFLRSGEMDTFNEEEKTRFYNSAWFKCRKLESIIEDILNANTINSGKLKVTEETATEINLKALFEKIVAEFDPEIKERELILKLLPVSEELTIVGDPRYLEEAFNNLINNAIKYTPSRKMTSDVRAFRDSDGIITIEVGKDEKKSGYVLIKITDNGIGVDKKEIPKLFNKFERGENARNMYTDGSGLGLYIVKEIVSGHKGKVWLESELGKGTVFYVLLPMKPVFVAGKNKEK